MATSKLRVQVTLNTRTGEIVQKIAEDESMALSKVCSLLVEEALRLRGAYSKPETIYENLPDTPVKWLANIADHAGETVQQVTKKVEPEGSRPELVKEEATAEIVSEVTEEDLKLLKKLKMLKELNLL